jgi:hypothetical protein
MYVRKNITSKTKLLSGHLLHILSIKGYADLQVRIGKKPYLLSSKGGKKATVSLKDRKS